MVTAVGVKNSPNIYHIALTFFVQDWTRLPLCSNYGIFGHVAGPAQETFVGAEHKLLATERVIASDCQCVLQNRRNTGI